MSHSVTDEVWRWKQSGGAPSGSAHEGSVLRSAIQAAVAAAVGFLFFHRGFKVLAIILFALGSFLLISGLFLPRLFLGFERLGKKLGQVVGTGLTWLLLLPMFFLVFFTGRVLVGLCRKDPMCLRFPTGEKTYWKPRPPTTGTDPYRRQY